LFGPLDIWPRNKKLIAFEGLFGWFDRDQRERIPSTGRRPIVIKTAAEPHGVEALLEKKPATVLRR
jgi:hypothetical protein